MIIKKLPIVSTIFFCSIGKELASKISSQNHQVFQNFLSKRIASSIFSEPPNSTEISAAIQSLSANKAVGHDQIPPYLVHIAADVIAPYLQYFFEFSFTEGIFPESCTIAKVIPLHKNGDKTNSTNYSPISFLSCLSKILERLIYSRFTEFFSKHKVIYDTQYGFKKIFLQFMLFSIWSPAS